MLRVKSVVILKANPHILKRDGGIKMSILLCVERQKDSRNEEDMKKYQGKKKDAKGVVYMVMDQKARKAVEELDSCHYILSSQKTENLML